MKLIQLGFGPVVMSQRPVWETVFSVSNVLVLLRVARVLLIKGGGMRIGCGLNVECFFRLGALLYLFFDTCRDFGRVCYRWG